MQPARESAQCAGEFRQSLRCFADAFLRTGIRQADKTLGSEACAWGCGNTCFGDQSLAEFRAAQAERGNIQQHIECPAGTNEAGPGTCGSSPQIRSRRRAKDSRISWQAFSPVLQGSQGTVLGESGDIGDKMALQIADFPAQPGWCAGIADAPAGHGVRFAEAVDRDAVLRDLRA